jgi:hypothetical protein
MEYFSPTALDFFLVNIIGTGLLQHGNGYDSCSGGDVQVLAFFAQFT